jgi:predicted dehydrogenase
MEEARRLYPQVRTAPHWAELLEEGRCDCIVVATPTSEHYRMAKAALLAGKHVLVEKPMVTSLAEAKELAAIAHERHLVLMVDHTFVYNPVVARIKEELSSGACGRVHYVDSTRINLGIYQKDINVLWDLACHDISIVLHLIAEQPSHVRAVGRLNPEWGTEDLAYLFLTYPSGMLVQVSASWASPVKIRRMIIGAEKRMMIFDDIEPANKLVIHDYAAIVPGLNGRSATLTDYRLGDSIMPKFPMQEPLALVVSDFLTSAHEGQKPLADAEAAIRVIQVLESAEKSLREGGNLIALG